MPITYFFATDVFYCHLKIYILNKAESAHTGSNANYGTQLDSIYVATLAVKFRYSEKATKFYEISTLDLNVCIKHQI